MVSNQVRNISCQIVSRYLIFCLFSGQKFREIGTLSFRSRGKLCGGRLGCAVRAFATVQRGRGFSGKSTTFRILGKFCEKNILKNMSKKICFSFVSGGI